MAHPGSSAAIATASDPVGADTRALLAVMWRVYRRQRGTWRLALPFLLLLAGFAEGVGLTLLLPLFIALNETAMNRSATSRAALEAMTAIGLPVTIGTLLILLVIVIALKAGLLLLVMRHVAAVVVRIAHQFRLSLIDALNASGVTVVLITHDAVVAAHARRRLSIRDGVLAEGAE